MRPEAVLAQLLECWESEDLRLKPEMESEVYEKAKRDTICRRSSADIVNKELLYLLIHDFLISASLLYLPACTDGTRTCCAPL